MTTNTAPPLSVPRGAALYIGALLGPGVLLLPGLAASIAGPAAILAWAGLLGVSALFAVMFTALGTRYPGEGGVSAYAAAGLGPRAGYAVGWSFLLGVVAGAPVVCLIGGGYVASLAGGGQAMATAVAAGLLLAVLGLALAGMRASTGVQMVLVVLLVAVVVAGVAGSAPSARMANWHPFAPHGWAAVGKAASVIMLSFVGWEAVAPLTARFGNARRRLPRVVAIAFGTTAALYLTMAAATTAVLGRAAGGSVPLADLLAIAIGPAGRAVAAGAAVLLTLGAVNAYLSGAAVMARSLTARAGRDGAGAERRRRAAVPGAAHRDRRDRAAGHRRRVGAPGQHHAAGDRADRAVPDGVPGLHRGGQQGAARPGPAGGRRRAGRGRRDHGVQRVGGRAGRAHRRDRRGAVPPAPGVAEARPRGRPGRPGRAGQPAAGGGQGQRSLVGVTNQFSWCHEPIGS